MSIKEIQEMTGFSYSTISRVLNGKAKEFRISDTTCKQIQDAASSVNYRPNILARSLRLQKTMTIGLIVSDIRNPFFGELASRIESLLREYGYSTILCNTNEIHENEEFYLQVLIDRKVDGIIISPISTKEWDYLETIRQEAPVVLIDRIFYKTDLPWVTSDNAKAAERLANELIDYGYKRIAFLGGTPETYISHVRYQGFENAMKRHSIKIDKNNVLFEGYSAEAGEKMMEKMLEHNPDIEAVFSVNNQVFHGAMRVVQRYETKNKRSIMMAAFDIGNYCDIFKRPLLCANQDLWKLAKSAVTILLNQINKNSNKENQLIVPISIRRYRCD